ncbi:MAG: type VI-A CRISPR-associated RNA-guided ribonuclease Cas13a, partial [Roseicyclus sp.]
MRLIRPYGTSATEAVADDAAARRRVLRLRGERSDDPIVTESDLEAFATSHDRLVIAQWISVIDKIAAKPAGFEPPSPAQRALRAKLGAAAWAYIVAHDRLPNQGSDPKLRTLWQTRLEPYPEGDGKNGQKVRGRWYTRFAGDVPHKEIDAKAVVERIAEHLYERAQPIQPNRPAKPKGQIAHRAGSIAANAASLERCAREGQPEGWETVWQDYAAKGDVAAAIRAAAVAIEQAPKPSGKNAKPVRLWVGLDLAAAELAKHWARLFRDPAGGVLGVKAVKERTDLKRLFDLHEEVRGVYRRLLKRHAKSNEKRQRQGPRRSDVARLLPATMDDLRRLMEAQRQNRDVNALIRLGKVVHYEAARGAGGSDNPAHVLEHWPDASRLEASWYWTSDGQAEIKANEAFVRVWRRVLALMHRTATDWAAPDGEGDVTLGWKQAIQDGFDAGRHRRKVALLFGSRAR